MADEYDETSDTDQSSSTEAPPDFLDYQSLPTVDNDCEVVEAEIVPTIEVECPTCVPNPAAPVIDWTKLSDTEPFLNERKCTYSVTLITKYEGTGGSSKLQERLNEYKQEGVIKLLAHYGKALDSTTLSIALRYAGATDHFIQPRAKLKMKVLIEIPANEFDLLPEASDIPDVSDSVEEAAEKMGLPSGAEPASFGKIDFGEFDQQVDKLVEGLNVYAKYQAIFYQTQRGAVRFPGGAPVNLKKESDYLKQVRPALYKWLRLKGWVIRDKRGKSNRSQPFRVGFKEAETMEFGFNDEGKLSKITLAPHGTCAEEPTVIEGIQLYSLSNTFPFNRLTTVNWLKNLTECEDALIQRQGMMKWTEFAEKFVFPTPQIHQGVDITSTVSAIASAAVGQATDADIDTIHKSVVTMVDEDKLAAKTLGSWDPVDDFQAAADSAPKADRIDTPNYDNVADHLTGGGEDTKRSPRGLNSFGGAVAESNANESWPYKSSDPKDPTYRGSQQIWDPKLNDGKGGWRLETSQEAHDRSNSELAARDPHLTTSSQFIEGMCDPPSLNDMLNDLGEDFMNELFSIWDAISYQFHNFICMTPEQRAELLEKLQDGTADAQAAAIREATKILLGFMEMINSLRYNLKEIQSIEALYPKALDEITFCGLMDMMSAFIECLAQGFSLEELLEPLILAALAAMPAVELGKLFVGLPPDMQAEVLAKVEAEIGAHSFPWESRAGDKDPASESPYGNRPMKGSTGRSAALSSGGLAVEKGAARQDESAVTPALQALVRTIEDQITAQRDALQATAEAAADAILMAERADAASRDSDGDGYTDLEEGENSGSILTEAQIERRQNSKTVSDSEVYTAVLSSGSTAQLLSDYFTDYEISGYDGTSATQISAAPGDYISALQDLIDRVNSASTVTTSTEVLEDPFEGEVPEKSSVWKGYYYEQYSVFYGEYSLECEGLPEGADKEGCLEIAATAADAGARAYADGMESADKGRIGDPGPFGTRGSLGAALGSTVSTAITAYIKALIEYGKENTWDELMDALGETKGGQIVSKIIALIDCALPPLFDPPLLDFLNTLQIDFCNMVVRMTLPEMPKINWPNWKDFFKYLLEIAKEIIMYIAFRLLVWLLTKIIMMLFDSLCAALEKLAEAAMAALADAACAAMPDGLSDQFEDAGMCEDPKRNMLDLMKEAFCGPNATDAQAQEAANSAMRSMGSITEADAARMANQDSVNQLVADMSAVLTGGELTNLLLGNPDPVASEMLRQVVETENPDFIPAMASGPQIEDLFRNIGNMLPNDLKQRLREGADSLPAERPANPFYCSTEDEIGRFKEVRRSILMAKDGTTSAQADQQFDAMRGRALNDITEMAGIMQSGVDAFLADNLPPLIGEPDEDGCIPPNAVIPRDPDEMMEIIGAVNEGLYDTVDRAYYRDIIGAKGALAMILSDTNGVPWKRHQRKSNRSLFYSDYDGELLESFGITADQAEGSSGLAEMLLKPLLAKENGFYPSYVGTYFQEYLTAGKHNPEGYKSTATFIAGSTEYFPDTPPLGSLILPGMFPVTDIGEFTGTEDNPFYTPGEKEPDLVLKFRDNNKGLRPPHLENEPSLQFTDGFNLEYSSYIIDEAEEGAEQIVNTDNVYRLSIIDVANPFNGEPPYGLAFLTGDLEEDFTEDDIIEEERYTLTITGSLTEAAEGLRDQYDLSKLNLSPQVNCWNEFLRAKYISLGLTEEQIADLDAVQPFIGPSSGSVTHDGIMNTLLDYLGNSLATNTSAYSYGFNKEEDGDLTSEDKAYMSPEGAEKTTFIKYVKGELFQQLGPDYSLPWNGKPNMRKLRKYVKNNKIMGTSNHERMHFLSPEEYGGSWFRPPYYIEPPVSEGWIGIRDALIPELDGKDPKREPVCNFKDIKDRVDQLTKKMPDDPRMSECPDCVQELPYSRILDRASAAGMEGPILSIIRIYVVEEMIKAMPFFSRFKAKIPEVLDYTYVEYILANMKEDFTERLGRKRGFLKGDALWYTFLEQCVQSYCRQIQLDGREPPLEASEAIDALNKMQEDFHFPSEDDWREARRKAGSNPFLPFNIEDTTTIVDPEIVFGREVSMNTKLNWYRRWHLLQAVKDTEHYANTIVRNLIEEQLEFMADRFSEALDEINMAPEITNIYEYFLGSSNYVAGHENYALDAETPSGAVLPTILDVGYPTATSESVYSSLEGYTSFNSNLDVNVKIMETSTDQTITEDDESVDSVYYHPEISSYTSRFTTGEFVLEKYIRVTDKNGMGLDIELPAAIVERNELIDGVVNINTWKDWLQSIEEEYGDKKLSEFFGNLEFIYASDSEGNLTDEVTGIEGEMGIRYGLRLCYVPPESQVVDLQVFWSGSALHEGLQNGANWSMIKAQAMKEKAFYVTPATLDPAEALNIIGTTIVNEAGAVVEANSEKTVELSDRLLSNEEEESDPKYEISASRYIIPLVSAEYDALDHTISDHIYNIDNEMDLYCLGKDLINQPEFELLFQYIFPLNRLTSIMGIYTGMGFLMSIGEKVREMTPDGMMAALSGGIPTPDAETGEWQSYHLRRLAARGGRSFDGWDFESLFPKTKKSLVQMFRSYFKSREFLSNKDDEDNTEREKGRASAIKDMLSKKKGKKGSRKMRRRRRDRPFDKHGN